MAVDISRISGLFARLVSSEKLCGILTEYGDKWRRGIFPAAFDDEILTKSNHWSMLMMEKFKKPIIYSAEDIVLNIGQKDIEQYLSEVKEAVEKDNYRLDRNARRQDNINLFRDRNIVP